MTETMQSKINNDAAMAHWNAINTAKKLASDALRHGSPCGGQWMQGFKDPTPLETVETRVDGTEMLVRRYPDGTVTRHFTTIDSNGDIFMTCETDTYCVPSSS